jgi:multidrug efflux pump subunit AcrB
LQASRRKVNGFGDLTTVLVISVFGIYLALLAQFKHAFKPLIVFAAIPYGITGAVVALAIMGQPFGFMAFPGIISLIGVIVSHIIVLFEFIEERREAGEELELALIDACILRLRPVMITVAATVIALFPLAAHGGPLWEPLCYAQIGGLTIATFVTLGLVPVLYSFVVLDLKLIRWEEPEHTGSASEETLELPATSGIPA